MTAAPALLRSQALSAIDQVVHGFTTRLGGVSMAPFDGCNLGLRIGDDRQAVQANRQQVLQALGCPQAHMVSLRQVHGAAVVQVTGQAGLQIEADGLWTQSRGLVLAIMAADCLPILFADQRGRAVAAAHAGWRGTVGNIGAVVLQRLGQAGVQPADVAIALGPCIGPCCFEVGPEVVQALQETLPGVQQFCRPGTQAQHHCVDLWGINHALLVAGGVNPNAIEVLRRCTRCDRDFFSYRGSAGKCGRQAGVIALQG